MLIDIGYILIGLLLLVKGGDYLVDGSVAIAERAGLTKMVIGLTVIGFGTSMPELLVSAQSALVGNSGIAIGNVVGSNISNIALILGITALVHPIPVLRSTLRTDMPFMLLACILFVAVALGFGTIGRIPGILFILMLIGFVYYQVSTARKTHKADRQQQESEANAAQPMALWKALLLVIVSFAGMVLGANLLVKGGSDIATQLGVTDRIIGLTIVAVGTSLPELFASVMAAVKGETDMAIGNIIGSVTFNVLSVIGVSAAISPIHEAAVGFGFDYFLMLALGLTLWFFLRTQHKLARWEGAILALIYVGYLIRTIYIG